MLKFSCKISEIFGSLGPLAGIAQYVKFEVENLLPFGLLKVWRVLKYSMNILMLVDLQSQFTVQISEPVNICLEKVLIKSLNW